MSIYTILGFPYTFGAFGFTFVVGTHPAPFLLFITTYIFSFLPLATAITLAWDVRGVARGETAVEAQDHELYVKWAKERGEMCPASSLCA